MIPHSYSKSKVIENGKYILYAVGEMKGMMKIKYFIIMPYF